MVDLACCRCDDLGVHVEPSKLASRSDIEEVERHTGLFSDPPAGLHTGVAWQDQASEAFVVFVWRDAGASTAWSQDAMWPKLSTGELDLKSGPPETVEPILLHVRTG